MDTVELHYYDEVHMKVLAEPDVRQELREYFKFRPLDYQFSPRYKSKVWDGYIYLYNPFKPIIYVGLIQYIAKFCEDRGYNLQIDPKLVADESVDEDYAYQLAKMINSPYQPRDYQNEYVNHCIKNNRTLVISPTSSGKSYILHLIQQHYYNTQELKTLVVVDRIGLVYQMASDFVSYGVDEKHIHKIMSGSEKNETTKIKIDLENGYSLFLHGNEKVKIINNPKINYKLAKDLAENDEIDDRWLSEKIKQQVF